MIEKEFWQGKRVFLTGHTGFKGSWLSIWLSSLGAEVKGYALLPPTIPSLFNEAKVESIIDSEIGDIRDQKSLYKSMTIFNPDILIHMAAQPLVRYSYDAPIETYEVNVIGTVKVLEVARSCSNLKAIVNITTDKCYENDNRTYGYQEDDPMGGHDPYSASKGCAELAAASYHLSFLQEQDIGLASVRAGNVIGGGDWANDRLIPDILRSFEKNKSVVIRNPKATRPWQHVLEPLKGYLILAMRQFEYPKKYSGAWNFGSNSKSIVSVKKIAELIINFWKIGKIKTISNKFYEQKILQINSSKAKNKLGWNPTYNITKGVKVTSDWYLYVEQEKINPNKITQQQIADYMLLNKTL